MCFIKPMNALQLMLDSWNQSIFSNIKSRLQNSAMKLVHAERNGEAFDSQLVIGVRESYGESPPHSLTLHFIHSFYCVCWKSWWHVDVSGGHRCSQCTVFVCIGDKRTEQYVNLCDVMFLVDNERRRLKVRDIATRYRQPLKSLLST